MEKKKRTPQEKKKLSLKKDHRSAYGENSKASRKAVPKRKKAVNKSFRKLVKNSLDTLKMRNLDEDELVKKENKVKGVKKKDWKKFPDIPLKEHIERKKK
jgi:Arc/MetJ family transcription regulator